MSYRIEVVPAAQRELKSLPAHVRTQAGEVIRALGQEPRPSRTKELEGLPGVYRVWLAGRWRIVYRIEEEPQVVRILRVRRKEQIDYDSLASSELSEP